MSTVATFLTGLVDDAAIFPPASLALADAVAGHREHRSSPYADLVGPFVVSDLRLPELLELLDDDDPADTAPFAVSVVVTGGAGAIEPAVRWATKSGMLAVRALETPLRAEDDLARNAERVVAAVEAARDDLGDVPVYVEPPRVVGEPGHGWLSALDTVAAAELRLKFRTGGVEPDLYPTSAELAASIDAALDRELPFKCTAGLHHAVRTGHEHGFLNVMIATKLGFDGGSRDGMTEVLDDVDLTVSTEGLESARRWFTSFGCCAVADPLEDLVELGLVNL
jgi:hypothetical protein